MTFSERLPMKKLLLKTALLTVAVTVILSMSLFGIMSLLAPSVMMDFTANIGLKSISGDYAYQEYERSGSIDCLARSFIVSADAGHNRTAEKRFDLLYAREDFGEFCAEQDKHSGLMAPVHYSYRGYVCGLGAYVRYRTAENDAEKAAAVQLAIDETDPAFPQGNSTLVLAVKAAAAEDTQLCEALLAQMQAAQFESSEDYRNIIRMLEEAV